MPDELRLWRTAFLLGLRVRPWMTASFALLTAIVGGLPVLSAVLTSRVFDGMAAAEGSREILASALALALTMIATVVAGELLAFLSKQLTRQVRIHAQEKLFSAASRFTGIRRFEDPDFLTSLSIAEGPGRFAPAHAVTGSAGVLQSTITLIGFLVALVAAQPLMAVLVVACVVPAMISEWRLSGRRAQVVTETGGSFRREMFYAGLLRDTRAAHEVRLFGTAGYLRGLMRTETLLVADAETRTDRREVKVQTIIGAIGAAVTGATVWWAILAATSGEVSVGLVVLLIAAVTGVQASATSVMAQVGALRESVLSYRHYAEIIALPDDVPVSAEAAAAPPLARGIRLEDVWFRYSPESPWILRGLSMEIRAGQTTALVGSNGAGKSTVVKLLCRLYDPSSGRITWDGVDLRDLDPATLRARMGAVFQDFMHYDLSARENIALGDLSALDDMARLQDAAKAAGIHEDLSDLPRAYDTVLSRIFHGEDGMDGPETGVLLSGGQWQRVALARAFVRDCDFTILDEPSSGLDAEAEFRLAEQLHQLRRGRTNLLISHRMGTLRDADEIVVLGDGVVAESGTHEELMRTAGTYEHLFRLQARGYADDGLALASEAS